MSLYAGKYGPYVKHGKVNATLPDEEMIKTVTLEEAIDLLNAKSKKGGKGAKAARGAAKAPAEPKSAPKAKSAPKPKAKATSKMKKAA